MSYSDSDSSSASGDYKNFRQISRERLLHEMLRSAKVKDSKSTWKVLIMDKVTVKIMSYSCKMADITAEGVSLVEDIYRRRQPLPSMDAIYFIQPTKENVIMFLSDMCGRTPLYKKAFVYFSSPVPRELVAHIKKDSSVLPRIGALSEMNLEYFAIDSQGFITDNVKALEDLFGDEENTRKGDACLNVMATRIATVFASLREFPFVRYRAAKSLDPMTMTTFRDLIPTKLAAGIWNCLVKYKSIPNFPQKETCELLILDRSIDQIAPVIHEWTYDAMCHDLLNMEGNKYVHEVPSKIGGPPEKKEVLLEEHDPIWLELRHAHIADASERLHEKMTTFISKNKAAQLQHGSRDGGEISTRELQKMVQALPQYSEQIDKLSLHVEIAGKINRIIREQGLRELGQLEQDLAFGDAGMKDVIKFLSTNEVASRENKLRLLMILAAIYPEKFEGEKGLNLMKLARLPLEDMTAVNNMALLAPPSEAKYKDMSDSIFSLNPQSKTAMKDTVFPSYKQATNGGGAAKPTFPATKSQLYGATRPLYRPQPKPHHYRRSCCCSCCIWTTVTILILLLLAGVSAAIFTLIYSPHRPTFTVSSLKVSTLKITSSSKLITNITLNVNAKNPNKELIYIYDPIAISLTTKNDVVIANGWFGPFVHGTKNNTLLKATINGLNQELDDSSAGELRVALKNKKGLPLKMKLDTKVKAKVGGLKTPKVGIRVICEGIKVSAPKGKSPSKASISNAKCKVDLRVKVWRWTF